MPCVKTMPARQGDLPGSGCRRDCLHRALVREYRETKSTSDEARRLEREEASHGYDAEGREWDGDNPAWTFRDFLAQRVAPQHQGV